MTSDIKAIAFYLPQFHPTRVNDVNWGRGFSDWVNVAKAESLFDGHYQPRLPSDLGFYDLRAPEVLSEQADLAQAHGVDGFCFYYYRFGNTRVLEKPLANLLAQTLPDMPFMFCWANESWTRAWDGRSDDLLLEQTYDAPTFDGLVTDLVEAMRDSRYIRVDGRPFFLIYQIELVPEAEDFVARLRDAVFQRLGEEISIGCVYSHGFKQDMLKWLDAVVQFPPHRLPRSAKRGLLDSDGIAPYRPERADYFEAYEAVVAAGLNAADWADRMYPGVTPDWDNSPRRPTNAHVLVGSTPDAFGDWVAKAGRVALQKKALGKTPDALLFINAWNEWGEGAMLEPSLRHGSAYLEALRAGLDRAEAEHAEEQSRAAGISPAPPAAEAVPDVPVAAEPEPVAELAEIPGRLLTPVQEEKPAEAAVYEVGEDTPALSLSEDLASLEDEQPAPSGDEQLTPTHEEP